MPGRWFLTGFQDWACKESYHLVVTTDAPCHLWLRYSVAPPQKHPRTRVFRGLNIEGDVYYCFTSYIGVEQNEAGDTLTHSFDVSPWIANLVRYFYLYGTVAGDFSPSQSPIFGRQIIVDTKYYLTQVSHAYDEVNRFSGGTRSCPAHCPEFIGVGRWQSPAHKEGGAFQFRDCQLPYCAEILNSYLEFQPYENNGNMPVHSQISLEPAFSPDDWYGADTEEVFTRWNTRVATVDWDDMRGWNPIRTYFSPDIKATIQALVNLPGWSPGRKASLFWDDFEQRTPWYALRNRRAVSFTTNSLEAPKLHVHYNHWQVKEKGIF